MRLCQAGGTLSRISICPAWLLLVALTSAQATPAAGGTQVVNNAMKLIRNAVTLFLMLVLLAIAWVYKNLWFDFVYRATCGRFKFPSVRDVPCLGCFLSNWICPCMMEEWHPPVNVRVVIHEVYNLRYASGMFGKLAGSTLKVFAIITAGNNPTKTTSMQYARSESSDPTVFNEPVDMYCPPSVSFINVEIRENDGDQVGDADIRLWDILHDVDFDSRNFKEGQLIVTAPMTFSLEYNEKYAGTLIASFEICSGTKPLPPIFDDL